LISDKSFTSLTEAESFLKSTGPIKSSHQKYYAVKNGHRPGVYTDWPTAQRQITGFIKPQHKSFTTKAEAEAYLRKVSPPPQNDVSSISTAGFGGEPPAVIGIEHLLGRVLPESSSQDQEPPTKKARRSDMAKDAATKDNELGGLPLGLGHVPEDGTDAAKDGFDYSLKMDPKTGELKRKTDNEMNATKIVARGGLIHSSFIGESNNSSGNEPEWIKVWTDGACKGNGKKGAVAGVGVWFGPNDPRYCF
jgi:ribonuclease HI